MYRSVDQIEQLSVIGWLIVGCIQIQFDFHLMNLISSLLNRRRALILPRREWHCRVSPLRRRSLLAAFVNLQCVFQEFLDVDRKADHPLKKSRVWRKVDWTMTLYPVDRIRSVSRPVSDIISLRYVSVDQFLPASFARLHWSSPEDRWHVSVVQRETTSLDRFSKQVIDVDETILSRSIDLTSVL